MREDAAVNATRVGPLRSVLRRTPVPVRVRWHRLVQHACVVRSHGVFDYARWTYSKCATCLKGVAARRHYRILTEQELRARRRSDRVFIFGSGYSLNDITPAEWRSLAEHDVFGFSGFVHQQWIPVGFHLIRAWDEGAIGQARVRRTARAYAQQLEANPLFESAVLLIQKDLTAMFGNTLVGDRLLRTGRGLFLFKTAESLDGLPTDAFRRGLTHTAGTLSDCINAASLIGWREIVLVGVDLYDSRYFWAPADRTLAFEKGGETMMPMERNTRGIHWSQPHNTVDNGLVGTMSAWRSELARRGIVLSVYNPRSLLAGVLPVYRNVPAEPRMSYIGG